jgi:hypothetical protein
MCKRYTSLMIIVDGFESTARTIYSTSRAYCLVTVFVWVRCGANTKLLTV